MVDNKAEITTIRIGLLGNTTIGKTCLCNTFFGTEFNETLITIGGEKFENIIKLENGKEKKN